MNEAEISRAMMPTPPASHKGAAVFVYQEGRWHMFAAKTPYKAVTCGPMFCRTAMAWYCSMTRAQTESLVPEVRRFIVEDVSVVLIVETLNSDDEHVKSDLYYRLHALNERVVHVNAEGHRYLQSATMCVIVPGTTPSSVRECAVMAACAYEQYCHTTELRIEAADATATIANIIGHQQ